MKPVPASGGSLGGPAAVNRQGGARDLTGRFGTEKDRQLAELAAKLGTSVDHLWGVLVRQGYFEGVYDLVRAALALLLLLVCAGAGWWRWRRPVKAEEPFGGVDRIGVAVLAAAIAFMMLTCGLFALRYAVSELFNPEYYALQHLPFSK